MMSMYAGVEACHWCAEEKSHEPESFVGWTATGKTLAGAGSGKPARIIRSALEEEERGPEGLELELSR